MKTAEYIGETDVTDPDTNALVKVCIYKHENGGIFAIDASFLESLEDDEDIKIYDPFETDKAKKILLLA
jgi:hypothetical protein